MTVLVTVTTKYGDPFLHLELGLLFDTFMHAGAVAMGIGRSVAVAEFRFRATSAKRAFRTLEQRLRRPTVGTAVLFVAQRVGAGKPEFIATSEGWPEEPPEVPAEPWYVKWTSPSLDSWEVL